MPNLRFPEFHEEWQEYTLSDKCQINPRSTNLPNTFVYIDLESVVNGILLKEERIFKSDSPSRAQRLLKQNDILFQMVRPYQKNNLFFDKKGHYVASTGYAQIRTEENPKFIFQYLHNQNFVNNVLEKCTGTSYPSINSTDLSNIHLHIPTIKEQGEIADFLSLIDERMQCQMKIIDQLETLMTKVSETLFSKKMRFKSNDGSDFSEWNIYKLGDIGQTYNGLTNKTKDDFGMGKPYIQYKQIFDQSKINISRCELVKIISTDKQNRVKKGDVFFTVSSETPQEIGMASVLLDDVEEMYLNSFCFGYRPNSTEVISSYFARYLFRSQIFRNKIIRLAQGSTRYNMSKIELMKIEILLPCLEEQTKIANFLTSLDVKIETEKQLLEQYKQQKTYLLQNLFI